MSYYRGSNHKFYKNHRRPAKRMKHTRRLRRLKRIRRVSDVVFWRVINAISILVIVSSFLIYKFFVG